METVINIDNTSILFDNNLKEILKLRTDSNITGNCKLSAIAGLQHTIRTLESKYGEKKTRVLLSKMLLYQTTIFITVINSNDATLIKKYFDTYYEIEVPIGYSKDYPQYHMLLKNKVANYYLRRGDAKVIIPKLKIVNTTKITLGKIIANNYKTLRGIKERLKKEFDKLTL